MRIYLDHNATSPLRPAARQAMNQAFDLFGNPSSIHEEGRAARKALEDARETLAFEFGCLPGMITYTSGGTEANNAAIRGASVRQIIVSAIEHPSVLEAASATSAEVIKLPVGNSGVIDLAALREAVTGADQLVSVMLANNETGVVQPVAEAVKIAKDKGAIVHVDAVQAAGKLPVNFGLLGCDMMTVAAHKIGGPRGIGALIIRDGLKVSPLQLGGGQELRRRAGTENLPAVLGWAAVASEKMQEIKGLRDHLESLLEDVVVIGSNSPRLGNTCCFASAGLNAETLLIALDLTGFAISSGSACSSGKVGQSHVLAAMGLDSSLQRSALRVSLGWNTRLEDIANFASAYNSIARRQRARKAA